MLKKLYEVLARVVTLTQRVDRHDKQIEELRQELRELTALVHRLVVAHNRLDERERHEREKIELRLENQLLRFERRLPPAKPTDEDKDPN